MLNTVDSIKEFCKLIKVNPKRIFIDSQGSVAVEFHSKKHSDRYGVAIDKYFKDLGYTGDFQSEVETPLEDWEQNLYQEMLSTRH